MSGEWGEKGRLVSTNVSGKWLKGSKMTRNVVTAFRYTWIQSMGPLFTSPVGSYFIFLCLHLFIYNMEIIIPTTQCDCRLPPYETLGTSLLYITQTLHHVTLTYFTCFIFLCFCFSETRSLSVARLDCSGMNTAHYSLNLLGSSDPSTSAS